MKILIWIYLTKWTIFPWRVTIVIVDVSFLDEYQQKFVDEVFYGLIKMLQHIKVSAYGRDAAMELMIKTVSRTKGYHWTMKFLDTSGRKDYK